MSYDTKKKKNSPLPYPFIGKDILAMRFF
jgi:hypothetical protein